MDTSLYNARSILQAPKKPSPVKDNNPRSTIPDEVHPKSDLLVNHLQETNLAALSNDAPPGTGADIEDPLPENVKTSPYSANCYRLIQMMTCPLPKLRT